MNSHCKGGRRGQAAIFDAIMFLLFVSGSIALMYHFFTAYGIAQDQTMRSAYMLAYAQDVGKALYYTSAEQLASVALPSVTATQNERKWFDPEATRPTAEGGPGLAYPASGLCSTSGEGCPYYDLGETTTMGRDWGCQYLEKYPSVTVLELLKRDLIGGTKTGGSVTWTDTQLNGLAAGNTLSASSDACLDNKFGKNGGEACVAYSEPLVPDAPGKLALRCALKEYMKPFSSAGYKYFAEIVRADTGTPVRQPAFNQNDYSTWRITNHWAAEKWFGCQDAISSGNDILTVGFPFRIPDSKDITKHINFEVRICFWQSSRKRV